MSSSNFVQRNAYVTPQRAHPYNKENRPVNSQLNGILDRISNIITGMNWHYRGREGEVIEFSEAETKPLLDAFKQLKNTAEVLKVSLQSLKPVFIPILNTYYEVTRDQGLVQFKSQLDALKGRKDLDFEELETQEVILKAKISNYEKSTIAEKYLLDHIRLKLNMAEIRREESTRIATDEEHEFCMFLVGLYSHVNSKGVKITPRH